MTVEKGQGHGRLPVLIRLERTREGRTGGQTRNPLSGACGQIPLIWPRASEGTGPMLNVTEARGLHSGGLGLCTPPQAAGGAGVPCFPLGSGSFSEPRAGRMEPKLSGLDWGLMEPLTD